MQLQKRLGTGRDNPTEPPIVSLLSFHTFITLSMIDKQSDDDNHSDQLNPNNDEYQGDE